MIKDATIEQVRQADIQQVIGNYIKLDRHGKACCPFHEEKTASFSVEAKKSIYKCFGCGASGDAIHFVMEKERLDFIGAVEKIAAICNIPVEYEHINKEEAQRQRNEMSELRGILTWTVNKYRETLWNDQQSTAWKYLNQERKLEEETIAEWQIGFAKNEWRNITPYLVESGKYKPALDIGLIKSSSGKNYDAYRSRIIFPIQNERGEWVGLGGRHIQMPESDGSTDKPPKYLNSPDSRLYNKSRVLFGLYNAEKAIRTQKKAFLVEGYLDVISMHQAGLNNTVATCGTALTSDQAKLLRRYTDHVTVLRDGDAAGQKAAGRDIPLLLSHGFRVETVSLPAGEDPDSTIIGKRELFDDLLGRPLDAVLWISETWIAEAGDEVFSQSEAIANILEVIGGIPNGLVRNKYLELLCKRHKWKIGEIKKQLEDVFNNRAEKEADEDDDDPFKDLPPDVDRNDVIKFGFFERVNKHSTGYYFLNGNGGKGVQLTNFVIKPLYHIYSQTDNRRMISITNGYYERILDMPSDKMLSVEYVCGAFFREGNFVPKDGFAKGHLYKVLSKIGDQFPICYEIKKLGWQPEGFFAFNNFIYQPAKEGEGKGSLEGYNDYGIVKVGEQMFLSPSVSKSTELIRGDDNIYENDQYLTFKESVLGFEGWCKLMCRAYEQHAWMAIPFAVSTLMRDIIRQVTKIPHLYLYGQVGSGKSEFGESVFYLFFSGKDMAGELYKPMNLNQGTDYAFFNRMERFVNVPNALNEFDENAIPDEWFRAIKSAYDGEGREKGRKERDRATTQKINCTLVLMGQYLGTKDDNSVLTRSLPLALRKVDNRPVEQEAAYHELKEHEKRGLSGILTEMMDWRPLFKKKFAEMFYRVSKQLQEESMSSGGSIPNRIVKNAACMISVVNLISEKIRLPFSPEQYYNYARDFMNSMAALIVKTSGISEFWSTMEFLLDRGQISEGFDFFIDTRTHVLLRPGRDKEFRQEFPAPKKLLFMRINNIHKLYRESSRKTGSDAGLNESTLLLYMKEQPYFIGQAKSERFATPEGKQIRTSCIVVDYDKLDINLERFDQDTEDNRHEETVFGEVMKDAEETTRKGTFKFILTSIRTTGDETLPKTETIYTTCFTTEPTALWSVKRGERLHVTGLLSIKKTGNKEHRTMDVIDFKTDQQINSENEGDITEPPF